MFSHGRAREGGAEPEARFPTLARAREGASLRPLRTRGLDHLELVDRHLALARGDLAELAVRADTPRAWSSAKHRSQRTRQRGGAICDEQHAAHGDLEDRHAPTLPVEQVPGASSG